MSKEYEFRKDDNQLLGSSYGYTPEEAAKLYFFGTFGVTPISVVENSNGTFNVLVKGEIFKMSLIDDSDKPKTEK